MSKHNTVESGLVKSRASDDRPKGPSHRPAAPLSAVDFAQTNDIVALLAFLGVVRDEIDGGRVDDELLEAVVVDLAGRRYGVALIVRGDAGIEASIGLRLERPLLSRGVHLRCLWNAVLPEARRTGHARSLILRARQLAEELGRPLQIEEPTLDWTTGRAKLIGRHLTPAHTLFVYTPA